MHFCILRDLHNHRAPTVKVIVKVMNNNDCLSATEKRGDEERGGEEEEEEIRSKGTALDAYHQRELNSCNRSKKHP